MGVKRWCARAAVIAEVGGAVFSRRPIEMVSQAEGRRHTRCAVRVCPEVSVSKESAGRGDRLRTRYQLRSRRSKGPHLRPPRSPPHAHARSSHEPRPVPFRAVRNALPELVKSDSLRNREVLARRPVARGREGRASIRVRTPAHARGAEHGRVRCGLSSVGS